MHRRVPCAARHHARGCLTRLRTTALRTLQVEAGQTRHLITLTCDHGPGDCNYGRQQVFFNNQELPDSWSPISAKRVVGHILWNGMRDGADAGMGECQVCFQVGSSRWRQRRMCAALCADTSALHACSPLKMLACDEVF